MEDNFRRTESGVQNDRGDGCVEPAMRLEREQARRVLERSVEKGSQHSLYTIPAVISYGFFFGLINYFIVTGCNPTAKAFIMDMPYVLAWSLGPFPVWYLLNDWIFKKTDDDMQSPGLIFKLLFLAGIGAIVYGVYWLLSMTDGAWYNIAAKLLIGCLAVAICILFVVKVVKIAIEEIWEHKIGGIIFAVIVMLFVTNFFKYHDGDVRKPEDTACTASSKSQNIRITTMPHSHVTVTFLGKDGEWKNERRYALDWDCVKTFNYVQFANMDFSAQKKQGKKKISKMKKGDIIRVTVERAFFDDYAAEFTVK